MGDLFEYLLQDIDAQVHFIVCENCVGCNMDNTFHDCKALSKYARRRLVFDKAWERIGADLKDRVLKEQARIALLNLDINGKFFFNYF